MRLRSLGSKGSLLAGIVVVALASVAIAGSAEAGDVSSAPWTSSANDSALADMVSSPATPRAWQGTSGSSVNLFSSAIALSPAAFNMRNAIVDAGIKSAEFPNPWSFVTRVTIGVAGSYLAYKVGNLFDHWLMSQWGANSTGSLLATTFNPVSGTQCAWYNPTLGSLVSITYPSYGWAAWDANARGGLDYCSSAGGGVLVSNGYGVQANGQGIAESLGDVEANLGSPTSVRGSDGRTYYVWFHPATPGAAPPGASVDDIEPYSNQAIPNGDLTGHMGSPSTTTIVGALRRELTGPFDTCAGQPCPWGTGPLAQPDATTSQKIVDCVLTVCPSSALSDAFAMPNCYGMAPEDCESAMGDLGFTGTLDQTPGGISDVDWSQPAGVVVSTNPAAGLAVSTAASQVVEVTINPQACESFQTDNPHWSNGTGSMLSYVHLRCTYSGTVTYTATMWQCASDPGVHGVNIASAGCQVATTINQSVAVAANSEATAYCPYVSQGDASVPYNPAYPYWIATSQTTVPSPAINGPPSWSQDNWEPTPP